MSFLARLRQWFLNLFGAGAILCDSCRYDHPRSCHNPDRPNATRCKDYKPR